MKRMKIGNPTRTLSILIIAVMPFLFVSCFLFSPQKQGTGALSISVSTVYQSSDLSATIGDVAVASYRVTGLGPGGACFDPVIATSSPIEIDGLAPGDWDITVEGMNDANPQVILAEASRTLSITADKTTSAAFNLVPLEGAGTLSLTIKWPDGAVDIDEIRGTYAAAGGLSAGTFDWDVPGGGIVLEGYRSHSEELHDLATGFYAVMLSFYSGGNAAGPPISERATIYKDTTTSGTIEIPADFSTYDSPVFSPPGGTYSYAPTVTIESSTEDVDIYYTTDGSEPGVFSTKYTSPVYISSNVTLKAISINSTNLVSDTASDQYRVLANASLGSGSALIRYGSRLYLLGGKDTLGNSLSTVRSATVNNDGSIGTIAADAALPEGVAYGSAIPAGDFVYMIGGETLGGRLSSSVYYAPINSDGTLGFGGRWEPNQRPLPTSRSRAAAILHDGWIFLIGGITDTGDTDTIIRARIYQDGQVGQWYPSSQTLPKKVHGAAAVVLDNRLYVAGGLSGSEMMSDFVSYAIGPYGALSDMHLETGLPLSLYNTTLLADREDLIIAGGFRQSGSSSAVYRYRSGIWTKENSMTADTDGPTIGRVAGSMWYLPKGFQNQAGADISEPLRLADLSLSPEAPQAIPGSGLVTHYQPVANGPIYVHARLKAEPGTTLRYTTNDTPVTTSSAIYSTKALPETTISSTIIKFRAYSTSDGSPSPETRYDYRVRPSGMLIMIAGILPVYPSGHSGLDTIIMQEETNDTTTYPSGMEPSAIIWYRVEIPTSGNYRIDWADWNVDNEYSAKINLSFLESDLFTEVPDRNDVPLSALLATTNSPVHLYLQKGEYYLYIKDSDGLKSRTFGIALSRE